MKDTQKRFLGAVLAASSVAGIVAPSVTAMAAVSEEIKATPEELRGVINENLPKLKEDPKFSTFHKIKFAADRLRDYNNLADEAAKVMAEIAPYSEKVHTKEIIAIVDAMDKFGQEKNMASYDKILNTDLVALAKTDKDSADYLTQRLDSWGTDVVFKADENYSKATNAIIKVTELRKDGKLDEAKDQVDVAKKAISEIKLAVNKPYLEALLQIEIDAIEDAIAKQDLHVTSVVAKNGREIEVKFNKEVSKDSAENRGEYKIASANSDAKTTIDIKEKELQDDNKTVLLTLKDGNTLNNKTNAKYLVTVQDVLTENDEDMKDYSEIVSLFDNIKPEVTNLEYTDSDTLRVNFSEPVKLESADSAVKVKLNGANVVLPKGSISDTDDDGMYLEISKSKSGLDADKTYSLEIDGLTDYASNALVKFTGDINFKKDDVDPEIEKIESQSKNALKVVFNEKVKNSGDDKIKMTIEHGSDKYSTESTDSTKKLTIRDEEKDPDDADQKTFIVELPANKEIDGNAIVTVTSFKDLAGNKGEAKTQEVKFEESHPALESTTPEYKTIDGKKYAVYSFDRDVEVGTNEDKTEVYNKVEVKHIDSDGVTITDKNRELKDSTMKDSKGKDFDIESNEIAVDINGLEEGKYNFDLEKENVKDDYGQKVEKINLEFAKTDKTAKIDVLSIVNADKDGRKDNDKIEVTFKDKLTKQGIKDAADASKYVIGGNKVAKSVEVKEVTIKIDAKDVTVHQAILTLKDDAITNKVDDRTVEISGIDGVTDFNNTVSGILENEKPVIDKAEAISYDTIKLTMSEEVEIKDDKADNIKTLDVKVANDTQEIAKTSVNGNVITIKLDTASKKDPLKTDSKITIKVTDDDKNNVSDLSGNKTKEVTKDIEKNFNMTLVDAIDAVNALKGIAKPTLDDVKIAQDAVNLLKEGSIDRINLQKEIDLVKENIETKDNKKITDAVTAIGKNFTATTNLVTELNTKINDADVKVSIESSKNAAVDKDGKVTIPASNTTGIVEVKLTSGTASKVVELNVTVEAAKDTTAPTAQVKSTSTDAELQLTLSEESNIAIVLGGTATGVADNDNDKITFSTVATAGQTVKFTLTDVAGNNTAYTATFDGTVWNLA